MAAQTNIQLYSELDSRIKNYFAIEGTVVTSIDRLVYEINKLIKTKDNNIYYYVFLEEGETLDKNVEYFNGIIDGIKYEKQPIVRKHYTSFREFFPIYIEKSFGPIRKGLYLDEISESTFNSKQLSVELNTASKIEILARAELLLEIATALQRDYLNKITLALSFKVNEFLLNADPDTDMVLCQLVTEYVYKELREKNIELIAFCKEIREFTKNNSTFSDKIKLIFTISYFKIEESFDYINSNNYIANNSWWWKRWILRLRSRYNTRKAETTKKTNTNTILLGGKFQYSRIVENYYNIVGSKGTPQLRSRYNSGKPKFIIKKIFAGKSQRKHRTINTEKNYSLNKFYLSKFIRKINKILFGFLKKYWNILYLFFSECFENFPYTFQKSMIFLLMLIIIFLMHIFYLKIFNIDTDQNFIVEKFKFYLNLLEKVINLVYNVLTSKIFWILVITRIIFAWNAPGKLNKDLQEENKLTLYPLKLQEEQEENKPTLYPLKEKYYLIEARVLSLLHNFVSDTAEKIKKEKLDKEFSEVITIKVKGLYLDQFNAKTFNSRELVETKISPWLPWSDDFITTAEHAAILLEVVYNLRHNYVNQIMKCRILPIYKDLDEIDLELKALGQEICEFVSANYSYRERVYFYTYLIGLIHVRLILKNKKNFLRLILKKYFKKYFYFLISFYNKLW